MLAERLGIEEEASNQGAGCRGIDPGRADAAGGRACRRLGQDEAAALLLPVTAGPAVGPRPRYQRIEAGKPFVAIERADIGIADCLGMLKQALAEASAYLGSGQRSIVALVPPEPFDQRLGFGE